MRRKRNRNVSALAALGAGLVLFVETGCSFREALRDGLFGGISDAVAFVVSDAALSIIDPGDS